VIDFLDFPLRNYQKMAAAFALGVESNITAE